MSSKIALVTGANKGLGFETSRQLAKKGFKVYMGCRSEDKGLSAQDLLKSEQLDVEFVKMDVTKTADIRNFLDILKTKNESIDVLVNNAGVLLVSLTEPDEASVFKVDPIIVLKTIESNTLGPFKLVQSIVPMMMERGSGRVINISSGMGQISSMGSGWPGYRMSKSALNALTKIVDSEIGTRDVYVNSVCPGWVKTDMGGGNANLTPEQGVETIVWLATCEKSPRGKFLRDKEIIEW